MTEGDSGWAGELLRALGGEEIKNFGFCPIIIVWKYVWDGRIPPTRQAAPLRTRGMLISIVTPENFGAVKSERAACLIRIFSKGKL